ncbi:2-oxoglutarate-dependent dioxygenase [Fulvia fulva]|uniref:2-oxoglutarate-dependent dioxygenase n=1 Tax=Passalora fulva TaxID=5499 RepID=A0A9Q8P3J3_PASFU|nr:2-oxoglutarate-dependent dioxygenase [Fulvia fulva]KAK4634261.1 2-oxoglutarate-dependent dioxygenase [Fulvia fulva]KAK4638088.1 2-oxoglutarate-dependent dioxygenase [Fulvia fulva]UJO11821.1 2-oxoglutarate-dependent dioxygenase [Fulvia fulva]WPV10160.1 2-oxoglutarate-dependent dioxygenase [Fulvia fulva]WPV24222.1 2-oxoglutarate-dependent dioxygenase [Fulvia fulva]
MPHAQELSEFTPDHYPPFPESAEFPTIDLETISLARLQDGDPRELDRVFEACKSWGFFYLELPGCEQGDTIANGADDICRVAEKVFHLPLDEKLKYEFQGKDIFGYKGAGRTVTDKNKTPDTAEFFNVAKNDMIVEDGKMRSQWPDVVKENKPLFRKYQIAAHSIGMQILEILANRLGIDPNELHSRHELQKLAGDHVRMTRGPPRKNIEMPEIQTPSHTDFGTITILMNWLGGLQVYATPNKVLGNLSYDDDDEGEWRWVKPKKNCAIINLGDAAVKFTNGVLCSGRHRVVPSPGEQGKWPRYSIVYFVRPNDDCNLKPLKGHGVPESDEQNAEGINAKEWIFMQTERLRTGYAN